MPVPVKICDADEMRSVSRKARSDGQTIALVPTMGGLHEGHLALIDQARNHADLVIASIFVNPTQFAPDEDFDAYPRDMSKDLALLGQQGCDIAYCPQTETIYPRNDQTRMAPASELAQGMEGEARPHFFAGVVNVVCRLLRHTEPDMAIFGEKDFQQLRVIDRMIKDLGLPVQIRAAPTIRASDGLALSTRNAYLNPQQRRQAPALYRAIVTAAGAIASGAKIGSALQAVGEAISKAGFTSLDYALACDADTLVPWAETAPAPVGIEGRVLVAARLGAVRLIDNIAVIRPD